MTFRRWHRLTFWLPSRGRAALFFALPARWQAQAWAELGRRVEAGREAER